MQVPLTLAAVALLVSLGSAASVEWPQWRGPFNTGMAIGDAPVRWDASNIRWQLPIPGRGHSTPVQLVDTNCALVGLNSGNNSSPSRGKSIGQR